MFKGSKSLVAALLIAAMVTAQPVMATEAVGETAEAAVETVLEETEAAETEIAETETEIAETETEIAETETEIAETETEIVETETEIAETETEIAETETEIAETEAETEEIAEESEEIVETNEKNGFIREDGQLHYYINGVAFNKGLLETKSNSGVTVRMYFDKEGHALTNRVKETASYYRMNDDGTYENVSDGNTYYYYFKANGDAIRNALIERKTAEGKTARYYFDSNCHAVVNGLKKTASYYVVNSDGSLTNKNDGNEYLYYFKSNGTAFGSGLLKLKNASGVTVRLYFEKNCRAISNKVKSTSTYSVVNEDGSISDISNGKTYIYYFKANCDAIRNALIQIKNASGKTVRYFFDKNAHAVTNSVKKTASYYVVGSDGSLTNKKNGTEYYYYFKSNGVAFTSGLLEVTNASGTSVKYFFNSNGKAVVNKYMSTTTYSKVKSDGSIENVSNGTKYFYYFQNNAAAFNKGILIYPSGDSTACSYFDKDGRAYTKGFVATATQFKVAANKEIKNIKDGNKYYYYFKKNAKAYTDGLLKCKSNDGKSYYYFFKENGKAYTGGWKTIGSDKYYFKTNGRAVCNQTKEIDGKQYYFNKYAVLSNGWAYVDGTWCYMDKDTNQVLFKSNVLHKAWVNIKDTYSRTNYFMVVDCYNNYCMVFKGEAGNWTPIYNWRCCTGMPSHPTVKGYFTVQYKGYSFGDGYTCYYYTQFYGDYLFHSILYKEGTFDVYDGRLGYHLSHGCVRLDIVNAKWVWDNIPWGTKVYIY